MLNNNEYIGDDDIKRSSFPEWPTLIPTEESHSLGRHKSDAKTLIGTHFVFYKTINKI